jgi:hypothetical protein
VSRAAKLALLCVFLLGFSYGVLPTGGHPVPTPEDVWRVAVSMVAGVMAGVSMVAGVMAGVSMVAGVMAFVVFIAAGLEAFE